MTRIKLRGPEGYYRRRILEVFQRIYEKNDLPENDYKIFVQELIPRVTWSKRPEGDHRHRILEVFTKIYEKNDLPENDYKIFAEELMGVPALNLSNHRAWSRYRAAKAFKKGPIVPGGVLVVPEPTDSDEEIMPTDSDEESEPRSISPEPREAGNPHVIDLTTEA